MEEAEILCTRIAILAKGSLICIGSPQHLKSKYGAGYTLEIKLNSSQTETSSEERYSFVIEHFPDCKITEVFDDKAVFALTTTSVQSISRTFALLEERKYSLYGHGTVQCLIVAVSVRFPTDCP